MKELRTYQIELSELGSEKLKNLGLVYLAMQVRTGKTATALNICKLLGFKKIIFLTKKKAIKNIQQDYEDFGFDKYFELVVGNNESLHLIPGSDFDCLISDEHHRCGSFPKPAKITKDLKSRFSKLPMIFLSGTPNPESYSQIYHQFWVSSKSPFKEFTNFYKWANIFVFKFQVNYGFGNVNDYSKANKIAINEVTDKYFVRYTQEEAGFESEIKENILYCNMKESTYLICNKLKKDRVVDGINEVILADTAVKLMQKLHQLYSGTVKFESGNSMVIDDSKALFIKKQFIDKKIAIFYKFKEELNSLKSVFNGYITDNLEIFNSNKNMNIALQIVSGREGISLKEADYLVYYNIDFSAVSYWQSRDRLTTMERKSNEVFWIFSKGGIENSIYKSVMSKKDFTLSVFKKELKNEGYGI